jgi:hypothetical protein
MHLHGEQVEAVGEFAVALGNHRLQRRIELVLDNAAMKEQERESSLGMGQSTRATGNLTNFEGLLVFD